MGTEILKLNTGILAPSCRELDILEHSAVTAFVADAPAAKGRKTDSLITFVKDRLGHDWRYAIDATLATSELGYAPQQSFETGIELTLNWMLDNEDWWRAVMDGSYRDWISRNYADDA